MKLGIYIWYHFNFIISLKMSLFDDIQESLKHISTKLKVYISTKEVLDILTNKVITKTNRRKVRNPTAQHYYHLCSGLLCPS